MSLKGKFKQPLYKEDLVPVIKQGIFVAFVGGLFIGAVDLFISYLWGVSVVWMLCILMAYYLAKRIREAYVQYHIWYSIISVISFIIGFYFLNVVAHVGVLFVLNYTDVNLYLAQLDPLPYFWFLLPWQWFNPMYSVFSGLLNFIFFGLSIYYAYQYSIRR